MFSAMLPNQEMLCLPIDTMYYQNYSYPTFSPYPTISKSYPTFFTFSLHPISLVENQLNDVDYTPLNQAHTEIEKNLQSSLNNKQKSHTSSKTLRPKKNVQSNISNQVFSYITNENKSRRALRRILKDNEAKTEMYYKYIQCFTKSKKKYLSRKYLGDLCIFASNREQCQEIRRKDKLDILSIQEFRSALGYLVFHYLRSKCTVGVLTSTKLSSQLRHEHLERKRQILAYLEQYVRPQYKYGRK